MFSLNSNRHRISKNASNFTYGLDYLQSFCRKAKAVWQQQNENSRVNNGQRNAESACSRLLSNIYQGRTNSSTVTTKTLNLFKNPVPKSCCMEQFHQTYKACT